MPNVVIVLMGLPGCGKSTWAAVHYPNFVRLDGDALKTGEHVAQALDEQLHLGHNVIVDATNGTLERRSLLFAVAKKYQAVVCGIKFTLDAKACIARCRARHAAGGVKVPSIAVYKIAKQFKEPTLAEGFAALAETQ